VLVVDQGETEAGCYSFVLLNALCMFACGECSERMIWTRVVQMEARRPHMTLVPRVLLYQRECLMVAVKHLMTGFWIQNS